MRATFTSPVYVEILRLYLMLCLNQYHCSFLILDYCCYLLISSMMIHIFFTFIAQ